MAANTAAGSERRVTFDDIVDAVLAESFEDTVAIRARAKTWVNAKYGSVWDSEEWTFKQSSEAVTVTAGSQAVSAVAGTYASVLSLSRADGCRLEPVEEYRDFAARYLGTNNVEQGIPEAFTVVGSNVFVGPTSSETSAAYLLVGELALTLLSADGDIPAIPAHYHLGLVFDGKAAGLALSDRVLAQQYAALAHEIYAPMRQAYLRAVRGTATQTPPFRPGS